VSCLDSASVQNRRFREDASLPRLCPFDFAQGRPFDFAQGRPFDFALTAHSLRPTAYGLRIPSRQPSAVSRWRTQRLPGSSCQGQSPLIRHFRFPLCSCPLSRGVLTLGLEKRDQGIQGSRNQVPAVGHSIPLSLICLTCASDARYADGVPLPSAPGRRSWSVGR